LRFLMEKITKEAIPIRVLLADDHVLFRQGLGALLKSNGEVTIVGEATDGIEAVSLAEKFAPDVIIMDISMPKLSGLEATSQIVKRFPGIKVIILSRYDNYVQQALEFGALGYVHKDTAYDELKLALEAAKEGKPYLSPNVLQPVVSNYLQSTPGNCAITAYKKLTEREQEVFHLLVENYSRKDIAETLHISPKTVDRHKENMMEKLSVSKDEELIKLAAELAAELGKPLQEESE